MSIKMSSILALSFLTGVLTFNPTHVFASQECLSLFQDSSVIIEPGNGHWVYLSNKYGLVEVMVSAIHPDGMYDLKTLGQNTIRADRASIATSFKDLNGLSSRDKIFYRGELAMVLAVQLNGKFGLNRLRRWREQTKTVVL